MNIVRTIRQRPISAMRHFLRTEAAGGICLIVAALLAMAVANSMLADRYFDMLHAKVGPMSVLHWINDGLMALFFFLVGLEIKRELADGYLKSWTDRALPSIAAFGGMAVPALVYLALTASTPGLARGWAIPSATDIAFAIGVMALLGDRVPASLKFFLTTVAIVDDMGAVAIIAIGYTAEISGIAMLAALILMGLMYALNRLGVRWLWPYLVLSALLWLAVLSSGVHATIAGVLAASMIPIGSSTPNRTQPSPLHRLEHALHPWVAFGIVPIFGFANAGVSFAGIGLQHILSPLPLGIAAGLFFGKQTGIFAAVWLSDRLAIAPRPPGASWAQIYGTALLCGIGFTMSLFIGGLAFPSPLLMDEVKIGVLGGTLLSALAGFAVLRFAAPVQRNPA